MSDEFAKKARSWFDARFISGMGTASLIWIGIITTFFVPWGMIFAWLADANTLEYKVWGGIRPTQALDQCRTQLASAKRNICPGEGEQNFLAESNGASGEIPGLPQESASAALAHQADVDLLSGGNRVIHMPSVKLTSYYHNNFCSIVIDGSDTEKQTDEPLKRNLDVGEEYVFSVNGADVYVRLADRTAPATCTYHIASDLTLDP